MVFPYSCLSLSSFVTHFQSLCFKYIRRYIVERLWGPASYPRGKRGSFPGGKQPGRETDYSPPYTAKVKNACSYSSTPPIRLHGVMLS